MKKHDKMLSLTTKMADSKAGRPILKTTPK